MGDIKSGIQKIRAELADLNNDIVTASVALNCVMKRLRRTNRFLNDVEQQRAAEAKTTDEPTPWISVLAHRNGKMTYWAMECPDCGRFVTVHDMEKDIKFSYCPFCGKKRKVPERKGKDEKD